MNNAKKPGHMKYKAALTSCFLLFLFTQGVNAKEVDWGKVEVKPIKTFYPGVSSWEFVQDKDHGTGAPPVKKIEKSCADCHVNKAGNFDINADTIISGSLMKSSSKKPFEPQPLSGMPGFLDVTSQVAYDSENIYLRFQWPSKGASATDPSLAKDHLLDRISVQISDKIKTFRNYGCFITCHSDQTNMPDNRGKETKLYGYFTRDESGIKPVDTLNGYLSKGQFIDLWVASFEGKTVKVSDEYVLQDRLDDKNDLMAEGKYENGKYTVVFTRKLSTGSPGDIELKEGGVFNIAIAVHEFHNKGRKHYVSFPVSIGFSSPADINAVKF